MKEALIIVRVSEEDQRKGYGPDVQAAEAKAYCQETGLAVAYSELIQEESTSWDRPEFEAVLDKAMALKRQGKLEAVVFPRTDRLARKWDAFGYYLGKLRREGLEVHFARERTVAPDEPMQAAMLFLYGAKAHADADTIRQNTMRGRRMRAERDHMMPTGRSKWAHDYHPYRRDCGWPPDPLSGRYTVNPERAECVKRLAHWIINESQSISKCCSLLEKEYGLKVARSTVLDVLSDPALIGRFYAYRTKVIRDSRSKRTVDVPPEEWVLVCEDRNQAIISDQQFLALQERFKRNRENSPRNTKHHFPPLRSLIFCGCGRRMVGITNSGKPWYRCLPCKAKIAGEPLWEEIRQGLKNLLLEPGRLIPAMKLQVDSGDAASRLEEELNDKRRRLKNLDDAEQKALRLHLYLPNYPVERLEAEFRRINEQRQRVEQEKSVVERQLADLRQALVDEEGVRRFCEFAARNLDTMDDDRWRLLLEAMHLRVLVVGSLATVKLAVPTMSQQQDDIALCTSQSSGR